MSVMRRMKSASPTTSVSRKSHIRDLFRSRSDAIRSSIFIVLLTLKTVLPFGTASVASSKLPVYTDTRTRGSSIWLKAYVNAGVPEFHIRTASARYCVTKGSRFDEAGYIAIPDCFVWGGAEWGLEPPQQLDGVPLHIVKTCNATLGHYGEMAGGQPWVYS